MAIFRLALFFCFFLFVAFEFGRLGFFSFLSFWRFFDFSPGHGYGLHEEPPQRRRDWNGCELVSNYLRYRGRKRWTHSRRTQDYERIKCVHKIAEDSIKGRYRGLKPEIITGDPKLEAVSSGYTKDHSGASTSVARADGKTVGDHRTNGTGGSSRKTPLAIPKTPNGLFREHEGPQCRSL